MASPSRFATQPITVDEVQEASRGIKAAMYSFSGCGFDFGPLDEFEIQVFCWDFYMIVIYA